MKKECILAISFAIGMVSCKNNASQQEAWTDNALDVASYQLKLTATEIADSAQLPRSTWTGCTVELLASQLERC